MLALEVDALAGEQIAPDGQEFVRGLVTFVMAQEHPVRGELGRIAAGHDIQQQASIQCLVERRGLARRRGGTAQRGAQGHQQLDPLGHRNQAGGRHPGVEATAAGRDQQAVVAEFVGGHRDPAQVGVGGGAAERRPTQVAGVAGARQEPEDVRSHVRAFQWRARCGSSGGQGADAIASAPVAGGDPGQGLRPMLVEAAGATKQ